jgi:hypothetical protein
MVKSKTVGYSESPVASVFMSQDLEHTYNGHNKKEAL